MATNKRLIKSNDEAAGGASFNTVLYRGNGTTQGITGVGFAPDFVWVKSRDVSANAHVLQDTVRGSGQSKTLHSNFTITEGAYGNYGFISSFDSDGFGVSIGSTSAEHTNFAGENYVAWCWKAGGAAVTNTDGTITSQVSANPAAGFSIVSYTGNSVKGATVGHGLNSAPEFIIAKGRSDIGSWRIGNSAIGWQYYMNLDLPEQANVASSIWNSTNPTSSVFSLGNNPDANGSGQTKIAYCFHSVEGFSKFGSYVGNAPFGGTGSEIPINCGFEPAFVMIKKTNGSGGSWTIWDNKRDTVNPNTKMLFPDLSNAEVNASGYEIYFNINGFSVGAVQNDVSNLLGGEYIYMAFANQF